MVTLMRLSPVVPFSPMTALLALTPVGMVPFVAGETVGLLPFVVVYSYVGSVRGAARPARLAPPRALW